MFTLIILFKIEIDEKYSSLKLTWLNIINLYLWLKIYIWNTVFLYNYNLKKNYLLNLLSFIQIIKIFISISKILFSLSSASKQFF